MTEEMKESKITEMENKVKVMETDIKEIKTDIKNMPEEIARKISETVDMKIKLAISETEKKYQAKLIGLLLAIIGEGIGLIISFLQ